MAQGPGIYSVTLRVTDSGTPSLSATQTLQITVKEGNSPPVRRQFSAKTSAKAAP